MVDEYAELIWNYMKINQPLEHCDAVLVLGSIDERVAEYGAELFLQGKGDWLIISGGVAHVDDLLATHWEETTEAAHFAAISTRMGVPRNKILLESRATNTGENITLVHELLQRKSMKLDSILLVQKPYMERRTYATFEKQWPDKGTKFIVTSPPIPFSAYFNELQPKDKIISIMVGDLQRIKEYPKLGFQTEQEIPDDVWHAYEELGKQGYDKHLIK